MDELEDGLEVTLDTSEDADLNQTQLDEPVESSDLEARLAKAEELANNYKVRAEKAERIAKGVKVAQANPAPKPQSQSPASGEITTKDLYALSQAQVPLDDIDDVTEYARFKNISVQEALKSSVVMATLKDKAEQRNTALATNVGATKRSASRATEESLLEKARTTGELPDSAEDIARMTRARKGIK